MRCGQGNQGLKFLFLEPFYGGSHKDFAEGLLYTSSHEIKILSLPARFWKWRMRGAALEFWRRLPALEEFDGILTTNLMSLTDFKALTGRNCPPVLIYFHEDQLTYPLQPGQPADYHYPFTDIINALAAERVLFNSRSHMKNFFAELPEFIKMMPDFRPLWALSRIREKSGVCLPGCRFPEKVPEHKLHPANYGPPLIIWNHRWEYDKNPEEFFKVLYAFADKGINFRAAVMGQSFATVPPEFDRAAERLGDRIVQLGEVPGKSDYIDWLKRGTVVVSTAIQENFGIAIIEAARYGCLPLVPNRLSYPEIIPPELHETLLYDSQKQLVEKLAGILSDPTAYNAYRVHIAHAMAQFSWKNRIAEFDAELEALAAIK